MAHYAFLDENYIVTEVIVGKDGSNYEELEAYYQQFRGQVCKRTSYNTREGVHNLGGVPYRKNYAGIGYKYDIELDAFIPPKPFASWILDTNSCSWHPPVTIPDDDKLYVWDENIINWVEVN